MFVQTINIDFLNDIFFNNFFLDWLFRPYVQNDLNFSA